MDFLRLSILSSPLWKLRGVVCTPVFQPGRDRGWILRYVSSNEIRLTTSWYFFLFFSPLLFYFSSRVSFTDSLYLTAYLSDFPFSFLSSFFSSFQRREGRSRIARMKGKTSEKRTPDLSPDKSTYTHTRAHRWVASSVFVSKVESRNRRSLYSYISCCFLFSTSRFTMFQSFLPEIFIHRSESIFFSFLSFSFLAFTNFRGRQRFVVLRTQLGVR